MWVFCLHVCLLWPTCVQCLQRPEGEVGFPGTGVTGGCSHPVDAENGPSSTRAAKALNLSISQCQSATPTPSVLIEWKYPATQQGDLSAFTRMDRLLPVFNYACTGPPAHRLLLKLYCSAVHGCPSHPCQQQTLTALPGRMSVYMSHVSTPSIPTQLSLLLGLHRQGL